MYADPYARYLPTIHGRKLEGYGISTFCKISEQYPNDPQQYKCNFSFGTGIKKFGVIASYDNKHPDVIYIDRVENNRSSLIGQDLSAVTEGTAKLVRIGLYVMYSLKPSIKRFVLKDDSNLYCNGGDTGQRISMSYETLLKYNQTWYQQKFGAVLPGFLSSTTGPLPHQEDEDVTRISISINGIPTVFRVRNDSSMLYFLQSLACMDMPLTPYVSIIEELPALSKYKEEYESSVTPRQFMTRVRNSFRLANGSFDKKAYCLAVAPWFSFYMQSLRIPLYYDQWYIPVHSIKRPEEFKEIIMENANATRILNGGSKSKRKTRSNRRKDQWGIVPYYPTGRRLGGAEDLE